MSDVASQLRLGRVDCWNVRFLRDLDSEFAGVFQRGDIVRVDDVFKELRYTFDFFDATAGTTAGTTVGTSELDVRLSLWPVNLENNIPLDTFRELRPWFDGDEANGVPLPAPARDDDLAYYLVAHHEIGQPCAVKMQQPIQKHLEGL